MNGRGEGAKAREMELLTSVIIFVVVAFSFEHNGAVGSGPARRAFTTEVAVFVLDARPSTVAAI